MGKSTALVRSSLIVTLPLRPLGVKNPSLGGVAALSPWLASARLGKKELDPVHDPTVPIACPGRRPLSPLCPAPPGLQHVGVPALMH
jgi:hypothetical protein